MLTSTGSLAGCYSAAAAAAGGPSPTSHDDGRFRSLPARNGCQAARQHKQQDNAFNGNQAGEQPLHHHQPRPLNNNDGFKAARALEDMYAKVSA